MTLTTSTPENLIAGDYPLVTEPETIAANQVLKRGALLGRNTVTKKLHLCVAAAEDGTENPVAVLVAAMDTTGADADGPVYKTGIFHFSGLEVGAGWDKETLRAALDNAPLFAI